VAKGLKVSVLCGALFSLMLASGAYAQTPAAANCLLPPASLPDSTIQAFLSSPSSLLEEFQTGGILLSNRVRALAGTDAAALTPIIALAGQANTAQSAALGAGLARAAAACVAAKPDFAARIQEEVAASDNAALQTAFAAATPETQTAALGAAGAAGAGAAGVSAIGSNGNAGGGSNLTGNAPGAGGSGTASGSSAFGAGASSPFFASSGAASSITIAVSVTSR
jgi:hypothetical protein